MESVMYVTIHFVDWTSATFIYTDVIEREAVQMALSESMINHSEKKFDKITISEERKQAK